MKKIMSFITVVLFFMTVSSVFAEGEYDGIWSSPAGFISIQEKNGTLIVLNLMSDMSWEAYQGQLNGNTTTTTTLLSPVNLVNDVVFTSTTSATVTQRTCSPLWQGYYCLLADGTTYQIQKLW